MFKCGTIMKILPPMPEGDDYNDPREIEKYSIERDRVESSRMTDNKYPSNYPNGSPYGNPYMNQYDNGYGTRGRLGPSDLRNLASETPVIALAAGLASGATELANQFEPSGSIATHGLMGWMVPFMIALLLKVVAAIFRTHGKSWFESFGTKLWHVFNEKKRKQAIISEEKQTVLWATLRVVPFYTFISLILGVAAWIGLDSATEVDMPWLVMVAAMIGGVIADIIKSRV